MTIASGSYSFNHSISRAIWKRWMLSFGGTIEEMDIDVKEAAAHVQRDCAISTSRTASAPGKQELNFAKAESLPHL